MVVDLSKSKKLKNDKSKILTHFEATKEFIFLTPNAKKTFNYLRQAFIKVPILQYFDPKCHIQIESDALGYAIGEVLSQLTSNYLISNQGW